MHQRGVGVDLVACAGLNVFTQSRSGLLCFEVPQCDVHSRERVMHRSGPPKGMKCILGRGHGIGDPGFLADKKWADNLLQRRPCGGVRFVAKGFTPSGKPVFGTDLDHQGFHVGEISRRCIERID